MLGEVFPQKKKLLMSTLNLLRLGQHVAGGQHVCVYLLFFKFAVSYIVLNLQVM